VSARLFTDDADRFLVGNCYADGTCRMAPRYADQRTARRKGDPHAASAGLRGPNRFDPYQDRRAKKGDEKAKVELYNLEVRGRVVGNGWLVARYLSDGRRANTIKKFGADESAARRFAAEWNRESGGGGGGGRAKRVDPSAATVLRELTHPTKPIVIRPVRGGYEVHVNGVPLVRTAGGLNFPRQPPGMKKRPSLAPPDAPVEVFRRLDDAKHVAHQIGHYVMGLGDFVTTYVDFPGKKW